MKSMYKSDHQPSTRNLFPGRPVFANVPLCEWNSSLRKKVFRLFAKDAARLADTTILFSIQLPMSKQRCFRRMFVQ